MRRPVSNDLNERFQVDRVRLGGVSDHRPDRFGATDASSQFAVNPFNP
jgi:hypothetical protein